MFNNFKIKMLRNKVRSFIDLMDNDSAYEAAVQVRELLRKKNPDNNVSVGVILKQSGMDDRHCEYYNADYVYKNTQGSTKDVMEAYEYLQETVRELGTDPEHEVDLNVWHKRFDLGLINEDQYNIGVLKTKLKHYSAMFPENTQPELVEADKRELRKKILHYRFREGEIGFREYDKSVATLDNEKWVNYQIKIDPQATHPNEFEIDIDYNRYFIDWLKHHEVALSPSEQEGIETDEEYDSKLLEKWAKSSLIALAATMLEDDGGETFRSVVASEPEAKIVEHLEIDREAVNNMKDELSEEDFNRVIEIAKNRRMYK